MTRLIAFWHEWAERRQILRDVRHQVAENREHVYFKIKDDLAFAMEALDRGDRQHATELWLRLLEQYPVATRESPQALKVLLGLERFDEAESLMQSGQKRRPGDPKFLFGLAEIATRRRDFDLAIDRWAIVRKRFPGIVESYVLGASALVEKGQLELAEELALQATKRFPDHIGGPLEYARIAVRRKDWQEALRRWQPIRDQFGYFGGCIGAAQALSHLGRHEEAEELLQEARLRFGTDPGLYCELARVAEAKGDTGEAIQRWKSVCYRFPLDMHVYLTVSEALEQLGEPTEAVTTLHAAIDRFPAELRPMLDLARLLYYKHRDFPAAAEAWAALRKAFPDDEEAYTNGAEALRQAGHTEEADALREEYGLRFKSC